MTNKNYNVLIVDDDEFLLDIYSRKFKEAGVSVEVALGGEEALEKIKANDFDIVLLDIVMPGMDGLSLLEKIKKDNLAENTRLIVLSNQGQPTDIEKAKVYDIDGYIVKASTVPSEVLEKVLEIAKGK